MKVLAYSEKIYFVFADRIESYDVKLSEEK